MKKIISSFLVFLLCFNIVAQNTLILSNAEDIDESISDDSNPITIESELSQDSEQNNALLESIDNNSESTSQEDTEISENTENEEQPDPEEIINYSMGESSSTFRSASIPSELSINTNINVNAIGSGNVNTDNLNVRSEPSTSSNKLGTLKNGDYVEIYARSDNWYKIIYNNQFAYVSCSYITLNILEKGIDVSKWNGDIDWSKVKASGIDYVIIRAGYGTSTVDPYFKSYIEGASAAGLKIGIYWFSYATSPEKARLEAEKCLQTINPYKSKITYPVYYDFEYASVEYAEKQGITVTKSLATEMANTFNTTIGSAGYDTGIYSNKNFSDNYFDANLLYSNNVWVAQYNTTCTFNKPYMMWQYSEKGTIDGINGYVDMNYTCLKSNKQDYHGSISNIISNSDVLDTEKNSVNYKTHIQDYGWQGWTSNGKLSGTTNESKRLEAIEIKLSNTPENASITYQTHVEDYGWLNWSSDGQLSGTTNESKRLEAIKIKLENMPGYKVEYRVHVQDYGWMDWKSDGEIAGTVNQSKRLEAIEIRIVKETTPDVEYRTHVQDYGWLNWTSNGITNGTTGESKRAEGIEIKLNNASSSSNITYQTHIQDYGWLNWSSNGQLSGTSGQSKRLEAIKIKLENMPNYTIKYRVHVQDYGWMDWKSDGEIAGTVGESKQIEAIEIKIENN